MQVVEVSAFTGAGLEAGSIQSTSQRHPPHSKSSHIEARDQIGRFRYIASYAER